MSKIATIAWKDILLRFSSRSELLFFIILPLVFTFFLGSSSVGDATAIGMAIVDLDDSPLSQMVVTRLQDFEAVTPQLLSLNEAEALFDDRETVALLILDPGFGTAVTTGDSAEVRLRTQPNNSDGLVVQQAVNAVVSAVSRPYAIAAASTSAANGVQPFPDAGTRTAFFSASVMQANEALDNMAPQVVTTLPATVDEEVFYEAATNQSAGQLVTWVFIPLLGTSVLFAYERMYGTLRRLLTTPTRTTTYLLGTITGQLGTGLVQMALLIGFGVVVMGVNWGHAPLGLIILLVSFGLAAVAMGTMLGTFVRSDSQASNLSIMLGMTMALLGGCWFPRELFPPAARTVTSVLPTHWAMQGLLDLTLRGLGTADVLLESGVLLGFAVVFFAIGVWRFRYE
jgi:ABC-2 type transport system permease protein